MINERDVVVRSVVSVCLYVCMSVCVWYYDVLNFKSHDVELSSFMLFRYIFGIESGLRTQQQKACLCILFEGFAFHWKAVFLIVNFCQDN